MTVDTAHWVGLELAKGRYRVQSKLGAGGMGCVYRAWDQNLQSDVVIKAPRPDVLGSKEFAARFAREVRSLVKLAHPHIVKILDVGIHDTIPFAVLQYLPGGSLRGWQLTNAEGKRLPLIPHDLRGWLVDVADALDFIHRQHCIHRDVKPDNILFDNNGSVYLSDFGVAKVLAAESKGDRPHAPPTDSGHVVGTPQYMAPELLLGQTCDGRADQYALAVTVYELLSGRLPFDGPTPAAIFLQQTTQEATPLDALPLSIPPELAEAVSRGMARDPADRFPDCSSFAKAINVVVNDMTSAIRAKDAARPSTSVSPKTAKTHRLAASISQGTLSARRMPKHVETIPLEPIQENRQTVTVDTLETPAPLLNGSRTASAQKGPPVSKRRRWAMLLGALAVLCLTPLLAWLVETNLRLAAEVPAEATHPEEMKASQDPPSDPAPESSGKVTLQPVNAVTIKPGGTAKVRVRIVRQDYSGPIQVFIKQLPETLQASLVELEVDKDTADLQLVAAAEAEASLVTARVMVVAGELKVAPVPVQITVQVPITPRLAPVGAIMLRAGGNFKVPIKIERHGFQGPITLKIEGLPDQVLAKAALIEADQLTAPVELNALAGAEDARKEAKVLALDVDGHVLDTTSLDLTVKKVSAIRLKPIPEVSVRAGRGKTTFPIQVMREGFIGEIEIKITGLPEGIDLQETKPIPGNRNEVDVTLSADAKTREGETKARVQITGEGGLVDETQFTLKVWQLEVNGEVQRLLDLKSLPVYSIALSSNGRRLAIGGADALVRVWDMKNPAAAPVLFPKEHQNAVRCVAIDRKQKYVASGDVDGIIRVWDLTRKEQVGRFEIAHQNGVESVAFSPDGNWIASGGRDRLVKVWDAVKGQEKGKASNVFPVTGVTFTPDDMVVSTSGYTVVFRLLSDAREVRKLVHPNTVVIKSMVLSPAGDRALTASSDGFIRLWNVETGEEVPKTRFQTDKKVTCLAWSNDFRLVLTGSSDGLVRLWDMKTGEEIRRFRGHKKSITGVALTPDGFSAVSSSLDGTVRMWDLPQ